MPHRTQVLSFFLPQFKRYKIIIYQLVIIPVPIKHTDNKDVKNPPNGGFNFQQTKLIYFLRFSQKLQQITIRLLLWFRFHCGQSIPRHRLSGHQP